MIPNTLASLLWFLGIGALFYVVMRAGGCGSHAHAGSGGHERGGHEHGGATGGGEQPSETAPGSEPPHEPSKPVDPVCGMAIASGASARRREHMGRTFFFCSDECLRKLDADPLRYVGAQREAGPRHHARGC